MSATYRPEMKNQFDSRSHDDDDLLFLDAHTFKDLEIFESEMGGACLFEFCNLARTSGGEKVLRRRMERPWSNAANIRAIQESLSYIIAKREVFNIQPTAYVTNLVDRHYMHEVLPIVAGENLLEFGFGVVGMWINNDRHYFSIKRGVQVTYGMIQTLRRFVAQPELGSPIGELNELVEEMRGLLSRPGLSQVDDQEMGRGTWRILRLDQAFRIHENVTIDRLLQLVHELDALIAMADVTLKYKFVLPSIETGPLRAHAEGLVHPFVSNAVANSVELDQQCRALFLTGPNMAGKTTYLRAFATALYLAHLGMGVPARSFRFVPAQRLFSTISLSDDLFGGVSYFRAEALRVKAISQAVADGYRVVALMDEPFKGTNVKDAFDASLAILERFAARKDCLFMFSSHLIELGEQLSANDQVDCRFFSAEENEGQLCFDYLLHKGVSNQRLGMRVLSEEGIFALLDGIPK
ncbi:MAG: hypothetical protein V7459_02930 [Oceanicoccus sp.]